MVDIEVQFGSVKKRAAVVVLSIQPYLATLCHTCGCKPLQSSSLATRRRRAHPLQQVNANVCPSQEQDDPTSNIVEKDA